MNNELKKDSSFDKTIKFHDHEKLVEYILKTVELDTGISRLDFTSKLRKEIYIDARKKAAKLLIEEAQLSDEGIAKFLGVSRSTANTYRNSLGFHRRL
ncbi:hypothetical protein ATE47_02090 [Chryseobacterium sp. IHB B 17019]|uniref:SIMPL domain-containing protein n=1 Tax=Chryseobacterium sp. IHB B 17019 TaxID=1721091 RepID=UPI00071EA673|nr:SIMPL domain-containing protein [Chryseobacterium sp. IHB B 17019]ALR29396.1 hypothetical protein ATE47_02090 [Chryseobacterium sp. IHB B 17019]